MNKVVKEADMVVQDLGQAKGAAEAILLGRWNEVMKLVKACIDGWCAELG